MLGILIFAIAIAVFLAVISLFRPANRGKIGEDSVNSILSRLSEEEYIVLKDLLLKTDLGTSQIDHVIVSEYGIFVIETKNYSGLITGSENGEEWLKNVYGNKYYFRNPLKQNYGHVKALEKALNIPYSSFIPIVVFTMRATLKVTTTQPVVYTPALLGTVKSYQSKIISPAEVDGIAEKLRELNISTDDNIREHIQSTRNVITEKKTKIENHICPRCGGSLVKRTGKYGVFYGCSNYPKCRYTTHI